MDALVTLWLKATWVDFTFLRTHENFNNSLNERKLPIYFLHVMDGENPNNNADTTYVYRRHRLAGGQERIGPHTRWEKQEVRFRR